MERINAGWLADADASTLSTTLQNYRFLVRRFPHWLALAIGKADDARVRDLLVPNLIEECGGGDPSVPHLQLLDACIESCGLRSVDDGKVLCSTREAEAWFVEACSLGDTLSALAVLGPGTEAVAGEFLEPLQVAIERVFLHRHPDTTYFQVHRGENEEAHVACIKRAIDHVIARLPAEGRELARRSVRDRAYMAVARHAQFWKDLRDHVAENAGDGGRKRSGFAPNVLH